MYLNMTRAQIKLGLAKQVRAVMKLPSHRTSQLMRPFGVTKSIVVGSVRPRDTLLSFVPAITPHRLGWIGVAYWVCVLAALVTSMG